MAIYIVPGLRLDYTPSETVREEGICGFDARREKELEKQSGCAPGTLTIFTLYEILMNKRKQGQLGGIRITCTEESKSASSSDSPMRLFHIEATCEERDEEVFFLNHHCLALTWRNYPYYAISFGKEVNRIARMLRRDILERDDHIERTKAKLREKNCQYEEKIKIVGHSMGHWVVWKALQDINIHNLGPVITGAAPGKPLWIPWSPMFRVPIGQVTTYGRYKEETNITGHRCVFDSGDIDLLLGPYCQR
ncbi:MAG: alpha/beta hydrolase [Candidatus Brocadiales bacterium]